jgi:hypothetical protein
VQSQFWPSHTQTPSPVACTTNTPCVSQTPWLRLPPVRDTQAAGGLLLFLRPTP